MAKYILRTETNCCTYEFINSILFVTLKEDAELTVDIIKKEIEIIEKIVGEAEYAVFIDITKNLAIPPEVRKQVANYKPSNIKGAALLSDMNLATQLLVNFYIKFDKPKVPNKIFKDRDEAIAWLRLKLYDKVLA
ncbi:MAG: hypothetical protein WCP52_08885 [Bacteroidota bacterium]